MTGRFRVLANRDEQINALLSDPEGDRPPTAHDLLRLEKTIITAAMVVAETTVKARY